MNIRRHGFLCIGAVVLFAIACAQAPVPTPTTAPKAAPAATTAPAAAPAAKPTVTTAAPVATAAPQAAAAPKTLTKVKMAYTAASPNALPVWIAKDEKIFEKYGLDVDLMYIAGGPTAMQAMLAGEVPVLPSIPGSLVVQTNLAGADAVIIGGYYNTAIFYLMVAPSIQAPADLKGKPLGVSRYASLTDFAARFALKKMGLEPVKDVAILQMGGVPEILAGMINGAVVGGALSSPTDLKARESGFKEMMDIAAAGLPYPTTTVVTTRTYLRNNNAVALNLMRALVDATYVFKTNKPLSTAILGKYTQTDDKRMLDITYDVYVKTVEKIPYVSRDAMLTAIEEVAATNDKAKGADPDSFVDNQFVKQLEDTGFIKQLYKE